MAGNGVMARCTERRDESADEFQGCSFRSRSTRKTGRLEVINEYRSANSAMILLLANGQYEWRSTRRARRAL